MAAMTQRRLQSGEDRMDTGHGLAELLRDADRQAAWMLLIDGIPQSHVDLDDPGYLEFEYVRRLGHIIDVTAPEGQPLHVLHLGAGALTLVRYVAAARPGSAQLAVEVDEALWRFVKGRLPLRTSGRAGGRTRVQIGDARAVLDRVPAGSFDMVIGPVLTGGDGRSRRVVRRGISGPGLVDSHAASYGSEST